MHSAENAEEDQISSYFSDTTLVTARQIIRVQNLAGPPEHVLSEGVDQHNEMIAALMSRKGTLALARFKAHLDTVEDNLRGRLRQFGTAPQGAGWAIDDNSLAPAPVTALDRWRSWRQRPVNRVRLGAA